jgi:hypothetical protein
MEKLVIFISHRLESLERAKQIARALSNFGGGDIRVEYYGEYPARINYRRQIEKDLTEASWLILLYDGPQFEWGLEPIRRRIFQGNGTFEDRPPGLLPSHART